MCVRLLLNSTSFLTPLCATQVSGIFFNSQLLLLTEAGIDGLKLSGKKRSLKSGDDILCSFDLPALMVCLVCRNSPFGFEPAFSFPFEGVLELPW